jgi:hypothetical protein
MLVERVLSFDNLADIMDIARFKSLQVLLVSAVPLVTSEAFIVFLGNIF